MDSQRHQGRVAVVTGAGSGIGQAVALRLAGEGAAVVGCDVNQAGIMDWFLPAHEVDDRPGTG
jgi:NAD(P)-dependent dehydrogenase (short-subunit alcohol dehydrogenase family)